MQTKRIFAILSLFLVALAALVGVAYATDLTWDSSSNGQWDNNGGAQDNWSGGLLNEFPEDGDDATQDDSFFSRIDVDGDERCDNLTGDGGAANDRFVLVKAQKKLEVDLNLVESGSASMYRVRMQNGASGALTTVDVGLNDGEGNVEGMEFLGSVSGGGAIGQYLELAVEGDVADSQVTFGDDSEIDVSGDATDTGITIEERGEVTIVGGYNGVLIAGTASATSGDTTTVQMGDASGEFFFQGADDDWTLSGYTELTIGSEGSPGGYQGIANFEPLVTMQDHAKMTVTGQAFASRWEFSDNAEFVGVGQVFKGEWVLTDCSTLTADDISRGDWCLEDESSVDVATVFELIASNEVILHDTSLVTADETVDGVWKLFDDSRVIVQGDVKNGFWRVASDGGGGINWGLDVVGELLPDDLNQASGSTVRCDKLGLSDTAPIHPIWRSYIQNGSTCVVADGAWWEGAASHLVYFKTGNTLQVGDGGVHLSDLQVHGVGPHIIDFDLTGSLSRSVRIVTDTGDTIDFEAEGVNVSMTEAPSEVVTLEGLGPDYDGNWHQTAGEDDLVLFEDSACVPTVAKDGDPRQRRVREQRGPGGRFHQYADQRWAYR